MDVHAKRRIELIIERMAYKRACRVLEQAGMTGYTVLPSMAGFGGGNRWSRDADISAASDMVVIISIGDVERVDEALEQIANILGAHIGVVSVSDVNVLRPDRF
jgi:PII-like signaling protein